MRLVKMLGLAAVTALAAMAFASAGTASADVFCKIEIEHDKECPKDKIIIEEHSIKGTTEGNPADFLNGAESVLECNSTILGKIKKNFGPHKELFVLIEELAFTACTGLCSKVKGHSLPHLLRVEALILHAILTKHEEKGLHPAVLQEGCSAFKVNCLYQFAADAVLLDLVKDLLIAKEEPMVRSSHSALCPTNTKFDAVYKLYLDNPFNLTGAWATSLP